MLIILICFGLILGSAANALIDRLPRRESWFKGRSHCDKCNHELSTLDLIPVVSYLWLRGKCRYCHTQIPYRNLLVELLMGFGFGVFSFFHLAFGIYAIFWISTIIAVMDWETQLVSEILVLLWGIFVIADKFLFADIGISNSLIDLKSLIGLGVGVGLIGGIWLISKGKAMGFGDVEIAAVMGFWLGWPNIFWGLEIAFVTGAVVGLLQILRRKNKLKGKIAFGTFLIIGSWAALCLSQKFHLF